MIWNTTMECMPLEELKNIQSQRLRRCLSYIYDNSPVIRERLESAGIVPGDFQTIDDITRLPFTTKEDMRDFYPFGLFCKPVHAVAEIHVSSGTTGNPTVVGYTKDDIELWSEVMARSLCCAGGHPGDMVQNAYGYGLFTGGLGVHYGCLKAGMTVLPMSSGMTGRQLKLMQDFRPRMLCCTPSYALHMLDDAAKMGIDPTQSSWEIGVFGAEPWTEPMRMKIEKSWNMSATDIYGLSEIIGPGVAMECEQKQGLHIFSDVFYPEIIDTQTRKPVEEGGFGELVITTLTKQALPLLRYRTRDIVSMTTAPCGCGRTSPRISKCKGRTDDMIVVRGINVFPTQIEQVLLATEGTLPHYQIVVDRSSNNLDTLEVLVEVDEKIFSDEMKKLTILEQTIHDALTTILNINAKIRLVEPLTIERSMGKAKRVIDKRDLYQ